MRRDTLSLIALFLLGVITRLLPHPPNLTAVTAIPFGASSLPASRVAAILFAAMAISDIAIGLYDLRILASVYASLAVTLLIARFFSQSSLAYRVWGATAASIVFFLITNSTVWAFSPWYEKNVEGLMYSLALGLPFLRNMSIGNILYTVLISVSLEYATSRLPNKSVALSAKTG